MSEQEEPQADAAPSDEETPQPEADAAPSDEETPQPEADAAPSTEPAPVPDPMEPPPDPSQQSDEELVASIPPRDGGVNDPVAKASASLEGVDMNKQREAVKDLQQDLPSSGE